MPKLSAGLLVFKYVKADLHVLLVHPGGPFWARKDAGSWSIPKGEYANTEDPRRAADREFREELGSDPVSVGGEIFLGAQRQPRGKTVTAWAVEGDFDETTAVSNTFEMEWPRGSGTVREFPEVDRAQWFTVAEARSRILKGQVVFLDRLVEHLGAREIFSEGGR